MESWYKFVTPRKEALEGQSSSPNEFAIAVPARYPRDSEEQRLLDAMLWR